MTDDILELIEGASLLVSAVGYWPSFHDAAMRSILIEGDGSTVTIVFQMDEMAKGGLPDYRGNVVLRWHDVTELSIGGRSDEQHWLWHLKLNRDGDLLETTLAPNDGFGGKIRARRLEVISCEV